VTRFDLGEKCLAAHRDNVAMPRRLHEGDTLRLGKARILGSDFGLDAVLRHLKNRSFRMVPKAVALSSMTRGNYE
jgi:hypothetical protein